MPISFGGAWTTLPNKQWRSCVDFIASSKGLHYFHLYFWIIKDIAWMQGLYYLGNIFGGLAVMLSFWISIRAFLGKSYDEFFISIALLMWVAANLWWMSGDLHDLNNPNALALYDLRTVESVNILMLAFSFSGVYFLVTRPLLCVQTSWNSNGDDIQFQASCFQRFKDYERIHLFFWLGKDLAWVRSNNLLRFFFSKTIKNGS